MSPMPAIALAAAPGRRQRALDLAVEIERRGFAGIYCASFGDALGLCLSIAHLTKSIPLGTGIVSIYTRHPFDMAQSAAYLHEVSGGRFRLGVGVSHGPANQRLGLQTGKPLSDVRRFVESIRATEQQTGEQPPIALAALRKRMTALAGEIGQGAIWANASRSHLATSLKALNGRDAEDEFFVGDMLPTCIDDDEAAAAEVMRRTMTGYLQLPNYRNYWKEAGYVEEMEAVETALDKGDRDRLPSLAGDRFLNDCTLYGPVAKVREGLEAWFDAGMKTPILVPSSTKGGQAKAYEEIFEAFAAE